MSSGGVTGMESMSVAPRLSRAVQKLERWALHQQSKSEEPIAWDKINPRTDLKVLPYDTLPRILDDDEKCKLLLDKLVVVKLCGTLGRSLGTTQPKSLVEIRSEHSCVDLAVQQTEALNAKYNAKVLLVLATSDNTDRTVKQAVKKFSTSDVDIVVFNQTEYPREVWPVTPKLGEDGGYLTNNGDLFAAFSFSGKLDELLAQGKEYLFIANGDNLGATVDLNMLHYLSENQCDFLLEVTPKTDTDVENGAHVSAEANVELLEFEEASQSQDEKSRSGDAKVVNTNSTWVNLKAVKRLVEIEALNIYCSSKSAGQSDSVTFQLQTASGAPLYSLQVDGEIFENLPIEGNSDLLLVQFFDGSVAVEVPRTRFQPVRATADLLLFRSDLYTVKDGVVCPNPLRPSDANPAIELEGMKLRKMQYFAERLMHVPSLLGLTSLRVIGDVWFGRDVVLQGNVVIWSKKDEKIEIPDGKTLKNQGHGGHLQRERCTVGGAGHGERPGRVRGGGLPGVPARVVGPGHGDLPEVQAGGAGQARVGAGRRRRGSPGARLPVLEILRRGRLHLELVTDPRRSTAKSRTRHHCNFHGATHCDSISSFSRLVGLQT